jgi:hypothetical protein
MHSEIETQRVHTCVLTLAAVFLRSRRSSSKLLLLLLADLNELTGTSQPNAGGTLLPPQPPEPQRGHTQPEKSLAPQLASKAELPLTKMLRLPNSYQ